MTATNTKTSIKTGQLLLAEPFLADPYFRRAVVLICDQHDHGTVGFILNKSIEVSINELVPDFPYFDTEVFYGGPVQTDVLNYVHNVGHLLPGSLKVGNGIWWGGDFEQLKLQIRNGQVTKDNIRFFVGYTGWVSGQLLGEMQEGTWVAAEMAPGYIFESEHGDLWNRVMYNKGDKYQVLAHIPEYPVWN